MSNPQAPHPQAHIFGFDDLVVRQRFGRLGISDQGGCTHQQRTGSVAGVGLKQRGRILAATMTTLKPWQAVQHTLANMITRNIQVAQNPEIGHEH